MCALPVSDDLIVRVGDGKPVNIVATRTLWIGKHNLGRDLFEDRVGNIVLERVRRRLRGKHHLRVALPVCLQAILREAPERIVAKCLPELVDGDDRALAGPPLLDAVAQVEIGRETFWYRVFQYV